MQPNSRASIPTSHLRELAEKPNGYAWGDEAAAIAAELIEAREDVARLEYAMTQMFIVTDVGPETRRVYDTRTAIDERRKA